MRRWWRGRGWAAIAAFVFLAACASPAPSASQGPSPSGSESPSASRSPSLAIAWELVNVESLDTPGDLVIEDAYAGPTRVVITGQITGQAADPIGHPEPRAWYSDDGRTWYRSQIELGGADSPLAFDIRTIFVAGDRLYGFGDGFANAGSDQMLSVLFESTDGGATWAQVSNAVLPSGGLVRDVVAGGPGYVAVGAAARSQGVGMGEMIWTSPDGRNWEPIAQGDGTGVIGLGYFDAVAEHDGILIAVGNNFAPGHIGNWTSTNGLDWVETGGPPGTRSHDVTWAEAWLIVGDGSPPGDLSSQVPVVERSADDGATWQRDTLPPGNARTIWRIVATPDGLLAVGDGIDHAVAWQSTESTNWTLVQLPQPAGKSTGVTATVFRDRLLVAGDFRADRATLPVVWLSPSDQ